MSTKPAASLEHCPQFESWVTSAAGLILIPQSDERWAFGELNSWSVELGDFAAEDSILSRRRRLGSGVLAFRFIFGGQLVAQELGDRT